MNPKISQDGLLEDEVGETGGGVVCDALAVFEGVDADQSKRLLDAVGAVSTFIDAAGSVFEPEIGALTGRRDPERLQSARHARFCQDDHVTRGQMAAFLRRSLDS